jgi:hypothetical protein
MTLRPLALLVAPVMVACGEVNADDPDAALADAMAADAAVDAEPQPAHHQYVVDRLVVPRTGSTPIKLDIDGDGDTENRFASLLATFLQQTGSDLAFVRQADVDRGIDRGQVILLADVVSLELANAAAATFRTLEGATPSPAACTGETCRGHLAGGATFSIAPSSPSSSQVAGALVGNRLVGTGGALVIEVPTSAERTVIFELTHARVELGAVTEAGIQAGIIGGAITEDDFFAVAMPAVQEAIRADVAASCTSTTPPCNCASGSIGDTWISLFDNNPEDCRVSEAELRGSQIVRALFAPDLDLAPVDGTVDSLSVAFGITAVPASWPTAP